MSELGQHDRNDEMVPGCDCHSCAIQQRDALLSALKVLCDLKDMKDEQGKTAAYQLAMPIAWAKAKAAIAAVEGE